MRFYTNMILCFKIDSGVDGKAIVSDLITGLSYTLLDIPFMAGRVIPEEGGHGRIQIIVDSDAGVSFNVYDHKILGSQSCTYTYDDLEKEHFPPSKLESFIRWPEPRRAVDGGEPALDVEAHIITGGLFLRCSIHHSTTDASSWSRFFRTWSGYTKAAATGWQTAPAKFPSAALDRSPLIEAVKGLILQDSQDIGDAQSVNSSEPSLWSRAEPETAAGEVRLQQNRIRSPSRHSRAVSAWWYFSSQKLQELKKAAQPVDSTAPWVSTTDALIALIWRRWTVAIRCLVVEGVKSSTLYMPIDARSRLNLHPDYMGNAIYRASITSPEIELCSVEPDALGRTAARIRSTVQSVDDRTVLRALAQSDSTHPSSVRSNLQVLARANITISSVAKYQFYDYDWGCNLGRMMCMRWMFPVVFEGVVIVNPTFRDGGIEVVTLCDIEVAESLKADGEFTRFAEWRCH